MNLDRWKSNSLKIFVLVSLNVCMGVTYSLMGAINTALDFADPSDKVWQIPAIYMVTSAFMLWSMAVIALALAFFKSRIMALLLLGISMLAIEIGFRVMPYTMNLSAGAMNTGFVLLFYLPLAPFIFGAFYRVILVIQAAQSRSKSLAS